MDIECIPAFEDNYLWLVFIDQRRQHAAAVDPGSASEVLAALRKSSSRLDDILITHHHADHIGGVEDLLDVFPHARVYGPPDERIKGLSDPVRGGDRLCLNDSSIRFEVMDVPGHTRSHIAYYSESASGTPRLFCGDTLFACGCGRLFEGSAEQMCASLEKIRNLPAATRVYCAHEYTLDNIAFAKWVEPDNPQLLARENEARSLRDRGEPTVPSLLESERQTNPFLRWDQPSVIAAAERHAGRSLSSPAQVFGEIRSWKDKEFD